MGNQPTKDITASSAGLVHEQKGSKTNSRSDKMQRLMEGIMSQVVNANDQCFGGRLAPWGDYNYDLDCDWSIVKTALWKRRLAPFYTPLENQPEADLAVIESDLKKRGLHQRVEDKVSLWTSMGEDADEHRIHMSSNAIKRRDLKLATIKVKEVAWHAQQEQDKLFEKQEISKGVLELYLDGDECPICFLYYPSKLNVTSCCHQRICTECFVQMKRSPPHLSEGETNELVSEPVKCPFCATTPFTVCFNSNPIGPDDIRPKWQSQLEASQKRRLRRAAAATLLHANSMGHNADEILLAETLKLSLVDK